jgi:hypothetical protein
MLRLFNNIYIALLRSVNRSSRMTAQLNAPEERKWPLILYTTAENSHNRNKLNYKRRKSVASKEFLLLQAPVALKALTAQSHL